MRSFSSSRRPRLTPRPCLLRSKGAKVKLYHKDGGHVLNTIHIKCILNVRGRCVVRTSFSGHYGTKQCVRIGAHHQLLELTRNTGN